jgi:hypothetical protein
LKVWYSPRFSRQYKQLPPSARQRFDLINAQVKNGNLTVLRQNAWVYYAGLGAGFIAWGSPKTSGFYWRAVDVPAAVPIIL